MKKRKKITGARRLIKRLSALICLTLFSSLSIIGAKTCSTETNHIIPKNDYDIVCSYKDIKKQNNLISNDNSNKVELHNKRIQSYKNFSNISSVNAANNQRTDYVLKNISDPNLSTFDPDRTPASSFSSIARYDDSFYPFSNIREGDIVFETKTDQLNMGHMAYVYKTNKVGDSSKISGRSTYIQTIEAVSGGVQFGFLDIDRMIDYGVVILRVTNERSRIDTATEFIYTQLGKPYYFPLGGRINYSIDSDMWYCSELVNAAYHHAFIILYTASSSDDYVMPYDIFESDEVKYAFTSDHLEIRLLGKVNGKWRIEISNPTSSSITAYYNKKLAFLNDARDWSNLRDIQSVQLSGGSSITVDISTNLFATTATLSIIKNNKRYVSYCNQLNAVNNTMSSFKNTII